MPCMPRQHSAAQSVPAALPQVLEKPGCAIVPAGLPAAAGAVVVACAANLPCLAPDQAQWGVVC